MIRALIGGMMAYFLAVALLMGPLRPYVPHCNAVAFGFCKRTR